MINYLTHYYRSEALPFQSISALTDCEAQKIMEYLCDDSPIFSRFKKPIEYMESRRQTETWLRGKFIEKGGQPKDEYPLYAVLGTSYWIENHSLNYGIDRIHIPISIFSEYDISFTYPDSMVTYWLGNDKPADYYQPEYHGQIFTFSEAKFLLNFPGLSEEKWGTALPEGVIPYVEAQIWNHQLVNSLWENKK